MRRKDREVTDPERIEQVIADSHCCRIGFDDDGEVYIVPLSFGYVRAEDGCYTFYFHGADKGRKIDLIRKNPKVGFELDTNYELHPSDIASQCTAAFQSVIGTGTVSFVAEPEEKREGLLRIMRHYTGKDEWEFPEKMFDAVCVFKLVTEKLSCKVHL